MEIFCFFGRGYSSNCYLVQSDAHAMLIDPSISIEEARQVFGKALPKIETIVLTHTHFDHILYLNEWRAYNDAVLAVHEAEKDFLFDPSKTYFRQFLGREDRFEGADLLLKEGMCVKVGGETLTVMHTPGHTAGSICLFGDGCVFTGDTVFADGDYGRTDLFSGSSRDLLTSIKRLTEQKVDAIMYSGHGPTGNYSQEMCYFINRGV